MSVGTCLLTTPRRYKRYGAFFRLEALVEAIEERITDLRFATNRGSARGERRGGRQDGTRNQAKAHRVIAIRLAQIEPKPFLQNGLTYWRKRITRELAHGAEDEDEMSAREFSAGKKYAKGIAPYCHSRLASFANNESPPQ